MSRSLRTFSVLSRPCNRARPFVRSRHSLLKQNGDIRIQPVRVVHDRRSRLRRGAFEIAIALATFPWLWSYLIGFGEDEETKKATDRSKTRTVDDGHANEEEDDVEIPDTMPEDAIFIPLGFAHRRPQTYYKATDPEWQSFIEYRKDREREPAIKKELASVVTSSFASMKPVQAHLGTPVRVHEYWFDVLIPSGPPPEYERSGIEITDDYVAWTTRPVSAIQVARFQSALYPLPMIKSFWASYSMYWTLQVARLKQLLNVDPSKNSKPAIPPGMVTLDQVTEGGAKKESQSHAQLDKMSDPESSDVDSAKASSRPTLSDASKILGSVPSIPQFGADISVAVQEFKRTLSKTWRPPSSIGERGTFLVVGLVRIEGPKAYCVVEIKAYYHPRERSYTEIATGVRYLVPKRQGPVRKPPQIRD